jgi:hypothetical protein
LSFFLGVGRPLRGLDDVTPVLPAAVAFEVRLGWRPPEPRDNVSRVTPADVQFQAQARA